MSLSSRSTWVRPAARRRGGGGLTASAWGPRAPGGPLGGKGVVLSLMGDQATQNGRDRTSGFANCMKKDFPDLKVIEKPTKWQSEIATSITQTIVGSTPDLGAIYMQSDAVMLPG